MNKINSLHSLATKTPALLIPGGMGHIGSHAVVEGVARGWEVFPCSRSKPDVKLAPERVKHLVTPQESLGSEKQWYQTIKWIENDRPVVVFNCIGNPDAPDMEKANVEPAHAIARAVKALQAEGKAVKLIQASSMAAFQLPNFPYGRTKLQAEEAIQSVNPRDTLVMRIGYAVDGIVKGSTYQLNTTHAYDAPHLIAGVMAGLSGIVPIIGDGKQKFQPVAIKDIVHAVLNFAESTDQTGLQIVDGVGREAITQHEFYQIYADLANVKLRPIFLKPEVLKKFARQFPKGHLSEYAIVGLEQLGEKEHLFCSRKFEQILGRPTTTLKELYTNSEGKAIEYARPPIGQHISEIAGKAMRCSTSRRVLYHSMREIAPQLFSQLLPIKKK